MKKTFRSPAKVNMFLHVKGKRPDGYHNISSLMTKVSLFDDLKIEVSEGDFVNIRCPGRPELETDHNHAVKAAKELLAHKGIKSGINITLSKNVPSGAGLGGGSSNAAWTIRGLNEMLRLDLPDDEMCSIGIKIGADVPFFIRDGWALVGGIGDKIKPIKGIPSFELVIIYPGFGMSTKKVYESIGESLTKSVFNGTKLPSSWGYEVVFSTIHNDLEDFAQKLRPELVRFNGILVKSGAKKALLSGSGSSIFGVFNNKSTADKAFEKIKGENFDCGDKSSNVKVFRVTTIE